MNRRWWLVPVAGAVIVGVVIVSALSPSHPEVSTVMIWQAGGPTGYSPRNFSSHTFSLSSSARITGSFTSDKGITLYIMNETQYSDLRSNVNGTANSYVYTTGNVTSAAVSTTLSSGTYYLVFENTNFGSGFYSVSNVQVTQSFIATYTK